MLIDIAVVSLPFFQRALVSGLLLSALMACLGVFIVLRRMSFFSDAIGHAALTGIAIGLLLEWSPFISALIYSMLIALGIGIIRHQTNLSLDTLLGVFFAASVALGVILVQFTPGYQANLLGFLFGDILTISTLDLTLTAVTAVITGGILIYLGKPLISIAFNSDLAKAEGTAVAAYELIFLLVLAAVIALSVKLVGVVLVTALLVIPAATAHNVARSLASMLLISTAIGLIATIIGMFASASIGTASGPTIILTGTVFFALSLLVKPFLRTD
jgi:zinc transport system permease protein